MHLKIVFLLVIGCVSVMSAPQPGIIGDILKMPQKAFKQGVDTIKDAADATHNGIETVVKSGQEGAKQAIDFGGNVVGELTKIPSEVVKQGENLFDQTSNVADGFVKVGEQGLDSAVKTGQKGLKSVFDLPQTIINGIGKFNPLKN